MVTQGEVPAGQDSGDLPLTIAGREEIALVDRSVRMLNLKISAIVASPLKRAVQTAKIIASSGYRKENINLE